MDEETLFFDRTIKKIEFLFRYAGINIKSGIQTQNCLKSRIIYIINFIWLNIEVAGEVNWFIDGIKTGKDFLNMTYIAPCISISFLANFKGIFLIINEKHVHKLIDSLRELEEREKKRKQSVKRKEIIDQEMKFLNLVLNIMNLLYGVLVALFATSPLLIMALNYYQTNEVKPMLQFLVLFPFDPFQIKVWPFMFLHQFWSECIVSLATCSADYFFFICCTYIRIQFLLLRHDIENLIPIEVDSNGKFVGDEDFKHNFKKLIKWHQDLIESASFLEIIYSKSTLINFLSSSLIICLTGFNVTMVDDLTYVVTFLSFLFMSLVQVFFLCFFADLLMASSMEISDAIYNCKWYRAEAKIGKQLLMVQIRSQTPCKITASGFADVNLNSFMRVLSTAWSYFALLQTMYGN